MLSCSYKCPKCRISMKITLVHLDLGIGGAEQLVVSIATAMKDLGHDITIFTSHHDQNHCFEATKRDGPLGDKIKVFGDWLPRNVFGKFTVFFAIIRMIYLALIISLFYRDTDLVFIDGVSAPIPIFKLFGLKILFYCHFPDKLLCTERSNPLKQVYRYFVDWLEEYSTGCSDKILVNSKFTSQVFKESFQVIQKQHTPGILYPTIDEIQEEDLLQYTNNIDTIIPYTIGYDAVFVSLNRYERKKNITLAIDAYIELINNNNQKNSSTSNNNSNSNNKKKGKQKILLVVAGGYDKRVRENVEYLEELISHCKKHNINYSYIPPNMNSSVNNSSNSSDNNNSDSSSNNNIEIIFRTSISSQERTALLLKAVGLLYTPDREHFGIVPLEAMYLKCPVIAVNSGGPKETVIDGETGYLCEQTAVSFGSAMETLITVVSGDKSTKKESSKGNKHIIVSEVMGEKAKQHVESKFTKRVMKERLQEYLLAMKNK